VNLKISDIDSSNMQILIRQGKGRKDRYTVLSQNNLLLLRAYFRKYRPSSEYLFTNPNNNLPLSTRTITEFLKKLFFVLILIVIYHFILLDIM